MKETTVTSAKYRLNWLDLAKGLLVAMLTAFVATGGQMLEEWMVSTSFEFNKVDLILSLKAAIGAGIAYLIKNTLTPQQVITTVKVLIVAVVITSMSSCKVYNEFTRHCVVSGNASVEQSDFKVCLECDSVSTAIKNIVFNGKATRGQR